MSNTTQQPIAKVKRFPLEVSIWRHENKDRPADYTVTHSRSYKKGDKWFNVNSYRQEHLMILAKLISEADNIIETRKEIERSHKLVGDAIDAAYDPENDQPIAEAVAS